MWATFFTLLLSLDPAEEPESSNTFTSVSPSRSKVLALHIAVAAIVTTNAIKIARIIRLVIVFSFPLHLAQCIHQVDGRRPKDRDKQRREQKQCERN